MLFAKAEDFSSFVVGGENATIDEFPYMAGIIDTSVDLKLADCGGAIINTRSVLTVRS